MQSAACKRCRDTGCWLQWDALQPPNTAALQGSAVTRALLEPLGVCDTPVQLFSLSNAAWVTCTAGGQCSSLVGCTHCVPVMWCVPIMCCAYAALMGHCHHSADTAGLHAQDCTPSQLPALQIWDYISGKLKKDLQYQAEEQFMLHDTAVLALAFSSNSDILVSGSQDGKIKVSYAVDLVEIAHCLLVLLVKRSEPCCHA